MSAADPERIVTFARQWIGTPYRHQASLIGQGTDCLGLIRGLWRMHLGAEPERPPAYSRDWGEYHGDEVLWQAALRHLIPISMTEQTEKPGQILLFRMRDAGIAKHLGVQSDVGPTPRFIHAYSGHAVVESALSNSWKWRIVARFEFPHGKDEGEE